MIGAGASAHGRQTRPARSVPVTTISTRRLPQWEQTSRARRAGTGVRAPYRSSHLGGVGLYLMLAFPALLDAGIATGLRSPETVRNRMRNQRAALTLVLMLAIYGPVQAVARNAAAFGSLLGPLTAQRTADGMTISGTIRDIPAGTKMWVEIIHEPGGHAS
jgi:hypothetical protein